MRDPLPCPPMPALKFVPGPCPGCGAESEREANILCRPQGDDCAGEFENGVSVVPDIASLARFDAWCDAHSDCDEHGCKVIEAAAIAWHAKRNAKRRRRWMAIGFTVGVIFLYAMREAIFP